MGTYNFFDLEIPSRLMEYLNYCITVKNMSMTTVLNYKSDLTMFLSFIKKVKTRNPSDVNDINISDLDDVFIKEITLSDIHMFFTYITVQKGNGVDARARKTASIKSFFKYLETKAKIIDKNPAYELDSPKKEKRKPVYLTLEESRILLNGLHGPNKERDFCIVTLFLNCGLRLSELVNINISDIKGDLLTVVGKGNKQRTVYLTPACIDAIDSYLKVRIPPENDFRDALLISSRRKRINKRTVQSLLKKYFIESGFTDKKYTPHKLRHSVTCCCFKRVA